jgi:hypothetical protein
LDIPLNLEGWKAAIEVGFRLKDCGFKLIIHDYQQRTINTAKCIQLFQPEAKMHAHSVHSQRLGWLEGKIVNEGTLNEMRHYISHPHVIPHIGYEGQKAPQSFFEWLNGWFWVFDNLKRYAEAEKLRTLVVTHNRNMAAISARSGNWVDFKAFDCPGPQPCGIVEISEYLTLLRHGSTDFGT